MGTGNVDTNVDTNVEGILEVFTFFFSMQGSKKVKWAGGNVEGMQDGHSAPSQTTDLQADFVTASGGRGPAYF